MSTLSFVLSPMRAIETSQLTLEPQLAVHAEAMFAVLSDPAIYEFENAPPASLDSLRSRFGKLESKQSRDGSEQWLNWVVRLGSNELIGYVQATVRGDASAMIAYEFASAYWGRGLASQAVAAMLGELVLQYQTHEFWALLKRENQRLKRLLDRLGFALASGEQHVKHAAETDEALTHRFATWP